MGVQTVVAKLHAGVFFLFLSSCSLPFISSQLSSTPNCIAETPTALKKSKQQGEEGGKGKVLRP